MLKTLLCLAESKSQSLRPSPSQASCHLLVLISPHLPPTPPLALLPASWPWKHPVCSCLSVSLCTCLWDTLSHPSSSLGVNVTFSVRLSFTTLFEIAASPILLPSLPLVFIFFHCTLGHTVSFTYVYGCCICLLLIVKGGSSKAGILSLLLMLCP